MELQTKPFFVINRGGEKIVADDKGLLITDNQEIIDIINILFPKKEEIIENEIINKPTKKGK